MKTVLQIGYNYIVIPDQCVGAIAENLSGWIITSREYVDSKHIYTPDKRDTDISIFMVPEDLIREPTPEEKENQEIKDLKLSLDWKKRTIKEQEEKIEKLECKLKLMGEDKTDAS